LKNEKMLKNVKKKIFKMCSSFTGTRNHVKKSFLSVSKLKRVYGSSVVVITKKVIARNLWVIETNFLLFVLTITELKL